MSAPWKKMDLTSMRVLKPQMGLTTSPRSCLLFSASLTMCPIWTTKHSFPLIGFQPVHFPLEFFYRDICTCPYVTIALPTPWSLLRHRPFRPPTNHSCSPTKWFKVHFSKEISRTCFIRKLPVLIGSMWGTDRQVIVFDGGKIEIYGACHTDAEVRTFLLG